MEWIRVEDRLPEIGTCIVMWSPIFGVKLSYVNNKPTVTDLDGWMLWTEIKLPLPQTPQDVSEEVG